MSPSPAGAGPPEGGRRLRSARYGLAPLLALAATQALESGERQAMAQAIGGIQEAFGVSDDVVAILPALMTVVAMAGAFPFGMMADRLRRTAVLAGGMALWSLTMLANAVAPTWPALVAARMGAGAVEASGPAAVSLLADAYPVTARARVLGLYQAGALVGAIAGLLGGGVAVALGGWRWAFAMWVPLGLASAAWLMRLPEPVRGEHDRQAAGEQGTGVEPGRGDGTDAPDPDAADAEREGEGVLSAVGPGTEVGLLGDPAVVASAVPAAGDAVGWGATITRLRATPTVWFALVALVFAQTLLVTLQFWGVEFFKRGHGLDPAAAGAVVGAFGLASAVGILGGGYLSDRLEDRGVAASRVWVPALGGVGASLLLTPAFAIGSLPLSVPLFVVGGILLTLPVAPAEAMFTDVVDAELRGRASSLRSVARALAAAGPLLVGVISEASSLRTAMVAVSPFYAVGGLVTLFALRTYASDRAGVLDRARAARPSSP